MKINVILIILNLVSNDLGYFGFKCFFLVFRMNGILMFLDLICSYIDVEVLFEGFKVNVVLISLNLVFNWIGDSGVKVFFDVF